MDAMRIHKGILRIKDRDIIKVTVGGKVQAFYRSTGRNSNKPKQWLPFSGLVAVNEIVIWFDKSKFVGKELPKELERYGTQELKEVSEKLGQMKIPEGTEALPSEINGWLGYKDGAKHL